MMAIVIVSILSFIVITLFVAIAIRLHNDRLKAEKEHLDRQIDFIREYWPKYSKEKR